MHSVDIRERVVRAYKNGLGNYEYVGDVFVVGCASVKRWVHLDRKTGSVKPKAHGGGVDFFIDEKGLTLLQQFLAEDSSASLEELRDRRSCDSRKVENYSKKKAYRAAQRDTPENQEKRTSFVEFVHETDRRLVFIDEAGCQLGMDRPYARCESGLRAHCSKPYHRGDTTNLIGAIGVTKFRCMMTVDGTVNGDVFETFTRHFLCPNIRKEDLIVWDNLPCHHMKHVKKLVANRGAHIGASTVFTRPQSN